jgi:hypothetical protein
VLGRHCRPAVQAEPQGTLSTMFLLSARTSSRGHSLSDTHTRGSILISKKLCLMMRARRLCLAKKNPELRSQLRAVPRSNFVVQKRD